MSKKIQCVRDARSKLAYRGGDFGPGDFVWFEVGTRMEHGTTDEPCDLTFDFTLGGNPLA